MTAVYLINAFGERHVALPGEKWPLCGRPLFNTPLTYMDAKDVPLDTCPDCVKALDDMDERK